MRLTADLVKQAPAYMNPLGERELNLRGFKIPAIENLGATEDQYQVIDLSDNEILKIENFPLLSKLTTLILNNNRIEKIDTIAQFTPKLDALILTNNRLTSLTDLDPLSQFKSLRTLSLIHNPVTRSNNYLLYVIFLIPSLRILDFTKIKQKEREAAKTMFASLAATREQEAAAAKEKAAAEQRAQEAKHLKTLIPGAGQSLGRANLITEEQRQKIMAKIEAATSLAEIEKLENILKTGQYDENEMLDI